MTGRCAVEGCSSHSRNRHFAFPKDPEIRQLWITFCNREETILGSKEPCICIRHFEDSSFRKVYGKNQHTHLKPDALPTLFIGRDDYLSETDSDGGNLPTDEKDNYHIKEVSEENISLPSLPDARENLMELNKFEITSPLTDITADDRSQRDQFEVTSPQIEMKECDTKTEGNELKKVNNFSLITDQLNLHSKSLLVMEHEKRETMRFVNKINMLIKAKWIVKEQIRTLKIQGRSGPY